MGDPLDLFASEIAEGNGRLQGKEREPEYRIRNLTLDPARSDSVGDL